MKKFSLALLIALASAESEVRSDPEAIELVLIEEPVLVAEALEIEKAP
jgi:hypothetical protein